jgi:hypothetical protein
MPYAIYISRAAAHLDIARLSAAKTLTVENSIFHIPYSFQQLLHISILRDYLQLEFEELAPAMEEHGGASASLVIYV